MWQEKSALATIESFFRKDERFQLVQRLPWFYALSVRFLLGWLSFAVVTLATYLLFASLPVFVWLLLLAGHFICLYYTVTRSLYGNYTVVTQYAVYRYINKQIRQIDELPLSKVRSITVKQICFSPKHAVVTLSSNPSYAREMPYLKRLYGIKTAQQNPEKADMRSLSLGKPIRLRLVLNSPRETYMIFSDIKTLMGYSYTMYAKGRKHGKRNDPRRASKKSISGR